jgi:hypothetical protein
MLPRHVGARLMPAISAAAGLPSGPPSASVRHTAAKSILTKTSGFIAEAGFSHSLTPARNCTYGCVRVAADMRMRRSQAA